MPDSEDHDGGGIDGQAQEQERPLRWAPGELSPQQRISASLPEAEQSAQPGEPFSPPSPGQPLPSWERLEEVGFWRALFLTIKETLFEPSRTFAQTPREINLSRPLMFALLLRMATAMVGILAQVLWQALSPSRQTLLQQALERMGLGELISPGMQLAILILLAIVLIPFFTIFWLFVWSGLQHMILLLIGGAHHGYETTFRTYSYVWGAAAILGWLIGPIWAIVCAIIGLSRSQDTSIGKAAAAVLLPYLLCCCCLTAAIQGLLSLVPTLSSLQDLGGLSSLASLAIFAM